MRDIIGPNCWVEFSIVVNCRVKWKYAVSNKKWRFQGKTLWSLISHNMVVQVEVIKWQKKAHERHESGKPTWRRHAVVPPILLKCMNHHQQHIRDHTLFSHTLYEHGWTNGTIVRCMKAGNEQEMRHRVMVGQWRVFCWLSPREKHAMKSKMSKMTLILVLPYVFLRVLPMTRNQP